MKWLAKLANLFKFVRSVSVASVMRASKCTYHNNTKKSAEQHWKTIFFKPGNRGCRLQVYDELTKFKNISWHKINESDTEKGVCVFITSAYAYVFGYLPPSSSSSTCFRVIFLAAIRECLCTFFLLFEYLFTCISQGHSNRSTYASVCKREKDLHFSVFIKNMNEVEFHFGISKQDEPQYVAPEAAASAPPSRYCARVPMK